MSNKLSPYIEELHYQIRQNTRTYEDVLEWLQAQGVKPSYAIKLLSPVAPNQ
jgi:hypothetical protein